MSKPNFFIIYLANALTEQETTELENETDPQKQSLRTKNRDLKQKDDHSYSKATPPKIISQQYADDVSWIAINSEEEHKYIKEETPAKLEKFNLNVNVSKTEEIKVNRNRNEEYKNCKYLGSKLGTEEDVKHRKQLAIATYNKLRHLLKDQKISKNLKFRLFKTYTESIFLFNS